ncbi:hypothetical protein C8J57DRAFT_689658 [Mycena rebaudengoi]|nr:hypothetical protein C8J57DRAFT_689658 [Mycena rebaudengoi]
MATFPNELFLQILPLLCLKSLIAAHGVSQLWRHLVTTTEISAARRELLSLYHSTVHSPAFLESRSWLLASLQPFDRQSYVDTLLDQHNYLPDDFRLYILEWPARATVNCLWPGLPQRFFELDEGADGIVLPEGCNFLSCVPGPSILKHPGRPIDDDHTFRPPLVHIITHRGKEFPALLVWQEHYMTWLILEEAAAAAEDVILDKGLEGRVLTFDGDDYGEEPDPDADLDTVVDEGEIGVAKNWIHFLKQHLCGRATCRAETTGADN